MKLFQNEILVPVGAVPMVFQVLIYHLIRDIASTPSTVTDCPEVFPPVPLLKFWVLRHKQLGTTTLQPPDQLTNRQLGRVADVQVDMILTYNAFQYTNIVGIADLTKYVTATHLHSASKDVVSIFGHPDQMNLQIKRTVASSSIVRHGHKDSQTRSV